MLKVSIIIFLKNVTKTVIISLFLILLGFSLSFTYDLRNPLSFSLVPWNTFDGYLKFFLGEARELDVHFYYLSCVFPFWIILSITTSFFCKFLFSHVCGLIITLLLIVLFVGASFTSISLISVSLICSELVRKVGIEE